MIALQINDSNGAVVIYGNRACPPQGKPGYSNYSVESIPARASGDKTSVLLWQNGALAWVQPPATLATLSAALNQSLTALFGTAPIQAQVVFSNITTPIAKLVAAGQLAQAIAALQGMIDDDLVPSKYSALIASAVALITAQQGAFAAVMPAPAIPAA